MRLLAWSVLGSLATVVISALAARVAIAHVLPNLALMVVVFLAMRKEPWEILLTAIILGHVVGVLALAPQGLHETAIVVVALGVYLISGNLTATGSIYMGCVCSVADVMYHVVIVLLLIWQGREVGFSSWATAVLLPQSMLTGLWAWALYGPLERLDELLAPKRTEGLQWR